MNDKQKAMMLRLANLLRSLEPREFNMNLWVSDRQGRRKAARDCDMICCIGGWAALIHPDLEFDDNRRLWHRITGRDQSHAFASAFGLTDEEALGLTNYEAPHLDHVSAADACEALVQKYGGLKT